MGDTTTPEPSHSSTTPLSKQSTRATPTPTTSKPTPTTTPRTTTSSTTTQKPKVFRFPTLSPNHPTILPPGVTASTTRMTTSTSTVGRSPPQIPFTVVSRRTTSSTSVSASSRVHIQTPISQFSLNQGSGSRKHPAPHLRPSLLRLAAQGKKALKLDTPADEFKTPPFPPPPSSIPLTRQPPPNFEDVLRLPRSNTEQSRLERNLRHFKHLYKRTKRQTESDVTIADSRRLNSRRRPVSSRGSRRLNSETSSLRSPSLTRVGSDRRLDTNSDITTNKNFNSDSSINTDLDSSVQSTLNPVSPAVSVRKSNVEITDSQVNTNDFDTNRLSTRVTSRGRFRFIRKEEERRQQALSPLSVRHQTTRRRNRPALPISSSTTLRQRRPQIQTVRTRLRSERPKLKITSDDSDIPQTIEPNIAISVSSDAHPTVNEERQANPIKETFADQTPDLTADSVTTIEPEEATTTTETPIVYPETNFTCADKIIGGLYADIEADCVMFHICSRELDGR